MSFAIGVSDIKSFILQIITLLDWNTISLSKKVIAIAIISLDMLLFAMIIRVYMLPNKSDLMRKQPSSRQRVAQSTKSFQIDETNKNSDSMRAEKEERFNLREYFKTTSNWNIAIDVVSVVILLIEVGATGLEKGGILPHSDSTTHYTSAATAQPTP